MCVESALFAQSHSSSHTSRQFMFGGSREEKLRAAIKSCDLTKLRVALLCAQADKGVDSVVVKEAKALVSVLATEALQGAIERHDLMQLRMALLSAETDKGVDSVVVEAAKGVDGAMIQEAKTLLATQPLRTAMTQREVAGLRAAIEVAEREVAVDRTVVEVSKWVLDTKSHSASNACLIRYTSGSIVGCTHPVASHTPVGGGGPAAAASHRASSGSDGRHTEASRS